MVKNDLKPDQVAKTSCKTTNGKSAIYRSIASAAVKDSQQANKQRNIKNWYLINGKLVSDKSGVKVTGSKSDPRTAVDKKTKTVK
jgi:hypothetical protein